MNKPKSTTIELTDDMSATIGSVWSGRLERVAIPSKYKVYRKGGKIFLEVFHND